MGERANVVVVDSFDSPPLYLYTHWDGPELGERVALALSRQERWDDGPYLARIVFCTMIGSDLGGATGYGIATYPPDNSYPYLVLDVARERVLIGDASEPDTLRARIQGHEPEGFEVVRFADAEGLPARYERAVDAPEHFESDCPDRFDLSVS